jgi:hypothetical protein
MIPMVMVMVMVDGRMENGRGLDKANERHVILGLK